MKKRCVGVLGWRLRQNNSSQTPHEQVIYKSQKNEGG